MAYYDAFYLFDPGNVACEGKVFVHDPGYYHLLVTEEQLKRLPAGNLRFDEILFKRTASVKGTRGVAFHTFAGRLEVLETKDGGMDDLPPIVKGDVKDGG